MNRLTISLVAGGICAGFLVYCVYFDRKRRSDPNFKAKLKEKRLKELDFKQKSSQNFPDLSDEIGLQNFFISEMQLGQELLSSGDIENGTEHVAFAVLVSPSKEELLSFLSMQLPEEIFQKIMQKIPLCGEKLIKSAKLKSESSDMKIQPETKLVEIIDEDEQEFEEVKIAETELESKLADIIAGQSDANEEDSESKFLQNELNNKLAELLYGAADANEEDSESKFLESELNNKLADFLYGTADENETNTVDIDTE